MGGLVVAAQVLYLFILIYFIVHEGLKFKKERATYFKNAWNIYETILIITSIVGVSMFSLKLVFIRLVMDTLKEDLGEITY